MRISKLWKSFVFLLDVQHHSLRDMDAGFLAPQPVVLSAAVQVRRMDPAEQAKRARLARADRVVDRVRKVGATDDAYASVAYVAFTGAVEVARVGGAQPPEIAARYTALATGEVPVTIHDAVLSKKQLKLLQDALLRDREALHAEGIDLFAIGVQHRSGALRIAVLGGRTSCRSRTDLTPAIEETLLQRYGDAYCGRDKLTLVHGGRMDLNGRVLWRSADWPGNYADPGGDSPDFAKVARPRISKRWQTLLAFLAGCPPPSILGTAGCAISRVCRPACGPRRTSENADARAGDARPGAGA